jgi:hypothetical protein
VDVTRAVRRIIDDVFGDQSRLACKEFLSRLGHHIPLLDGGEYRHQIEAKMTKGNEEREPEHSISGVLSLALERLRYAGQLHFELFADDPDSYRLTIPGERRAISSISLSDSEGVQ